MDPFERVQLGNTGISVPRLGLGTAPLSGTVMGDGLYGGTANDVAVGVINRAQELGISYVDTAPLYGEGRAEARVGQSSYATADRDSFVISTKIGRVLNPVPGGMSAADDPDGIGQLTSVNSWTRDDVHRSIEESLKRLNLDSVEIIYVHDPDVETYGEDQALNEAFPALIELREQGTIKAIGCGMNEWQMPLKFIQRFDLDLILLAGRYTLLDHSGLAEFLPACVERDVKITVGGPYNSGILARDLSKPVTFNYEKASEDLVSTAKKLTEICVAHGVDLKAAALQFVLAHPAVATAVPGAQSISELEQNIAMVQQEIPAAVWSDMRSAGLIPDNAPTPE
ncbi:MAG: aldo/keto reductase [Chloroflexi bacterium]|mgnify:FL=1|jgi:D-threo-aldose 1-dehydrogenase|nr:aldo/keto reductase [Chloroflexota bacterium]MBT5628156.1 aldo/keto reductase [Chloroflexota bacterium]